MYCISQFDMGIKSKFVILAADWDTVVGAIA